MSLDRSLPGFKRSRRSAQILFLLFLGMLILSGGLYLRWDWRSRLDDSAQNILSMALAIEADIPKDAVAFVAAHPGETDSAQYQALQGYLSHSIEIHSNIAAMNIYTQKDGELVVLAHGIPERSPWSVDTSDESFWSAYHEGRPGMTQTAGAGGSHNVTVQAPILDAGTRTPLAVLALMFTVRRWDALSVTHALLVLLLILQIQVSLVAFHRRVFKKRDLQDQKNLLEKLNQDMAQMQNRFRRAQEIARVGNWEFDLQNRQLWVSEETLRIYGLPPETFGLSLDIFRNKVVEQDQPLFDQKLKALLEGNEPFEMQFSINQTNDEQRKVLYSTATVENDEQKQTRMITGVVRDITYFAQVSASLVESEERFRKVFEQSPLGIGLIDPETQEIRSINDKYLEILGIAREEASAIDWVAITHPGDRAQKTEKTARLRSGEISGYRMNKRYLRRDGSYIWVNLTVTSIQTNSGILHLNMVEDINDRMQAQQALQESERSKESLMANLPGMIYRRKFDPDWTMEFISGNCFSITGYRAADLLYNRKISYGDVIAPSERDAIWEQWARALRKREKCELEYTIVTAGGQTKWVWEQGQGIYDADGNVIAIEGIVMDITERKEKESRILYLSSHDILTGLYNRNFLEIEKIRLDQPRYLPLSLIIGDINGLKLINDALGHAAGDNLLVEIGHILQRCCRKEDLVARTGGDEFTILLPKTSSEAAHAVMRRIYAACDENNRRTGGKPYYTSISLGYATMTAEDETLTLDDIFKEAQQFMYKRKLLELKSLHSTIISSMKATMLEKSNITEAHAERLAALSKAVAEALGLNDFQLSDLELLCTLHDIGKIGVDDHILQKPGELTEEEWEQMKRHPEVGYRIAMASPELQSIADLILTHHERWDGKGYPHGLIGEFIPLLSRVLAVVDSYDAMTQDRPYRKAMSSEEAIAEIRRNAGTQFDPYIARIFVERVLKGSWEE